MKKEVSPTQKMLNVWAIILIVWSFYRIKLTLPEWFDEFIAKPAVFILPVYYYIIKIEHKPFLESIWFNSKKIFSDIYLGIFIGIIFAVSAFLSTFIKTGNISPVEFFSITSISDVMLVALLSFATATSEEILSRGFVLKRLYEESNNAVSASFNASVLFFILHIPILFSNSSLTGGLLLTFMFTDIILSFASSFVFIARRSLFLPILIHAFYNLAIILYF